MKFDEVWMGESQLRRLAELAESTMGVRGSVVEIGAWQGLSTSRIANAIFPSTIQVVDHWLGSDDMPPEIRARDNYSVFLNNMAEGTKGNFTVHRMDWRYWVKLWDGPIRFLHLDAGHTEEEVSDNLDALLKFAVKGSIFAGDDWNWTTVRDGVLRIFKPHQVHTFINKLWWVEFKQEGSCYGH